MRKTFGYILTAVVAALTLAACAKDDAEPTSAWEYPTFSALIDGVHTRATDDYWQKEDKIGISGGKAINICYITKTGEAVFTVETPDQQIYYTDNNPVEFTAYYPYNSSRDEKTGLISVTTSDQENNKSFDFLWATAEGSKNNPDVEFVFTHRMSMILLKFKNGKDMNVSALTHCRLNGLAVEGTFDTTTGICVPDESAAAAPITRTLANVKEDEAVNPILLFPQTVAGPLKLEIFDNNNQYFVCNLTVPDNELVVGTSYTYIITVNKTGLKVNSCTLSDWITTEGDKSEASSTDE